MGNFVGDIVLIQLLNLTRSLPMRGIHQCRQDICLQIVFQAAAVNSGVDQRGTARIGQVNVEVVYPRGFAPSGKGRGTEFVGYACRCRRYNQIFYRAASAQFLQGFADIAFIVDERYGSLRSE
ncbi:Uncharacterised protein [Neisseria meningitidis]|uniref:Uncharacterized protein n=1 Tax=Neisseria meningitidis TaxID=487 RepID=A0AB33TYP2_NEIME|nr:Uncharacterised protein [Neisseria meningitidis]CWN08156.1 Uncharacterised protein [Neisseria meningitidis]CWN13691.1 Uncharacterised protein [Neisseria meningitidis]CWN14871.1 Uncharacterised protein [Neisseria meningitidis]CWN25098.1 Uncharacterised protein [Neisseria meningitidis]